MDVLKIKNAQGAWVDVPAIRGEGVPVGGATGQALIKSSATDFDTSWGNVLEPSALNAYRTASAQDTIDSGKANVGDSYTKAESDAKYLTEHQSLSAYRTSADQDTIDTAMQGDIDAIEGKIPSQATSENQLADKNFVNSSIATETAHYISNNGQPFNSLAELEAYSGTVTNNDYAFVTGTDEQGNTYFDRYKASVSGSTVTWAKEYRLNNSSFTAQQWASISSGITASDKTKLDGIESGADVTDSANVKSAGATMGVKVAGTELVKDSDGKVDVPYANQTNETDGVVSLLPSVFGIGTSLYGGKPRLTFSNASYSEISAKTSYRKPLVPATLDKAILEGLMTNSQITTTAQKKAICGTIGAQFDGQFELIEEITLTEDVANIVRTQAPNSTPYNFKSIRILMNVAQTPSVQDCSLYISGDSFNNLRLIQHGMFQLINPSYSIWNVSIVNGYLYSKSLQSKSDIRLGLDVYEQYNAQEIQASLINKILIVPSVGFTAGTVIKIYGIWA